MLSGGRAVLLAAALLAALCPSVAPAQENLPVPSPLPPAAPVPDEPPVQSLLPPPDVGPAPGPAGWALYGPPSPAPGFFGNVELQLIRPSLKEALQNDKPLPATGTTIQPPAADLGWTVSPWFEVGYRMRDSLGLFAVGYRFFNSEGSDTQPLFGGVPTAMNSRLGLNLGTFDYQTAPYAFSPRWKVAARAGVWFTDVFFDARVQNALLSQQASDNYRAAGPHARIELDRYLDPVPGLSLMARADGACLFGRESQKFRQSTLNPDGGVVSELLEQNGMETVPVLLVEAGLGYTPPRLPCLHLRGGYVYEHWWYVGQLGTESNQGTLSATRGQFQTQGLFVRAWFDF